MAEKRPKRPLHTSPKGRFKYPHLIVPDTKFDKDGSFHVRHVVDETEAGALMRLLAPLHKEALVEAKKEYEAKVAEAEAKGVKPKCKAPDPQDFYENEVVDGEPTGSVEFAFKTKAKLTVKDKNGQDTVIQRVIPVFDAKGNRINGTDLSIWGGTVGKVSFFALPFYIPSTGLAGLSLRLAAVQVIDLVSGGGGSAERFGFGAEDGYEYEPKDAPPETGGDFHKDLDDEIPF